MIKNLFQFFEVLFALIKVIAIGLSVAIGFTIIWAIPFVTLNLLGIYDEAIVVANYFFGALSVFVLIALFCRW